jgi:hypothetical protein
MEVETNIDGPGLASIFLVCLLQLADCGCTSQDLSHAAGKRSDYAESAAGHEGVERKGGEKMHRKEKSHTISRGYFLGIFL